MLHGMQYDRPIQQLLGGKDVDTIRGNVDEPIFHWAKELGQPCKYIGNPTHYQIGKQRWEVRGLADSQSYRRIQGREYAGVMIDELTNVHPDAWDMAQTRMSVPGAKFCVTFNKLSPRHWTKLRVYDNAPALRAVVKNSLMTDNLTLPDDFIEIMTEGGNLQEHQRKRLVENQWASPEGQVYPHWTLDTSKAGAVPCYVGVDYGESGVTAAVYLQRTTQGFWLVTGEYYYDGRRQGKREAIKHAQAIVQAAPGNIVNAYVDPSAVALKDALRKVGVSVSNAYNDAKGYDITNGALQDESLRINDIKCPALVTEIEDLIYNETTQKPDNSCADHSTDCLRYVWCGVTPIRAATYGTRYS